MSDRQRQALLTFMAAHGEFIRKWSVHPPPPDVFGDDPKEQRRRAIKSGRWGVIIVFPWTTDGDVRLALQGIRKVIPKRHRDTHNSLRGATAVWLQCHGYRSADIARGVWGDTKGLTRPTKDMVIKRITEDNEAKLLDEVGRDLSRRLGRDATQAEKERDFFRKLRGSEPAVSAKVRMARARYLEELASVRKQLDSPVNADPVSTRLRSLFEVAFGKRSGRKKDQQLRKSSRALYRSLIAEAAP